jgi:hypothetical protein
MADLTQWSEPNAKHTDEEEQVIWMSDPSMSAEVPRTAQQTKKMGS